jgi:hypothetical protein
MPPWGPEDSSSLRDASRNVAQSMTRSIIRSALRAIAEQNEDWLEPFVATWCRHIHQTAGGNDGDVVVSWLRSELEFWKQKKDPQEDNNGTLEPEEGDSTEADLELSNIEDPQQQAKSNSFAKRPLTAWAKLRRLGESNDHVLDPIVIHELSYEEKLQQAIAQLDHYGMTNHTYWLHDQWPVIQRAAQHMRARLHPPPKDTALAASISSNHPTQTWDAQLSQALLPPDQHHLPSAENNRPMDETMQRLVDRKRKSVNKKRRWNAVLQQFVPKQKKSETRPVAIDTPLEQYDNDCGDDAPRLASQDDGSAKLDWKRAMEQEEASELPRGWSMDDCIHASNTPADTARLLGALRDLGHFHGFHQSLVDASAVVRPRDALRARLGNHRPEEIKKQRPWSKVLRTLSDAPQQHWLDLDVGHCILENAMDGTLYAFRSVEMCLRDEDT